MTKKEFFALFRQELAGLPKEEVENRVSFYEEMIDDRMAEGKSEQEAISDLGSVEEIVNQIAEETSLVKLVKDKVKPNRKIKGWEIALIICGFPLWFPLLLTASILLFVAYLLTWVFTIVAYAIEGSFVAATLGGMVAFFAYLVSGQFALLPLGASIMCLGASILFAFACFYITKGNIKLSKNMFIWIKRGFMRKAK